MASRPSPSPPLRLGPRPLPLHWQLWLSSLLSSASGLMLLPNNLMGNPKPELQKLVAQLNQQPASQLGPALAQASASKINLFLQGVERYRTHPYQRRLKEPPAIWQAGSTRLMDYGGRGQPVLVLPSLINRPTVLDLTERQSLLRWLTTQGLHVYLLDWGTPDANEGTLSIEDYLIRAGKALAQIDTPVQLVGYCMGGLLALALAARHPDRVAQLALLATPWDFHAPNKIAALRAAQLYRLWQPLLGDLPVDLIQTLFTLLDPLGPAQKFVRFAEMTDKDEMDSFVALEDWLNDGVPLTRAMADTCLIDWYERNAPQELVDPSSIRTPTLVMIPQQDRIVPPESAEALAARLPDCRRLRVPLGHIGMIVSHSAPEQSWKPLAKWLGAH